MFPGFLSLLGAVGQLYPQAPRRHPAAHSHLVQKQTYFQVSFLGRKGIFNSISGNILFQFPFHTSEQGGKITGRDQSLLVHLEVQEEVETKGGDSGRGLGPHLHTQGRWLGHSRLAVREVQGASCRQSSASQSPPATPETLNLLPRVGNLSKLARFLYIHSQVTSVS